MPFKSLERKISYFLKRIIEYPLVELYDQKIDDYKINKFVIPKDIYQTWENNLFGKSHYKEIIKFRSVNNNYNFFLFDKEKRDNYMKNNWANHEIYNVYTNSKFGQMKADIFRYCILYERGGYYFDISKGCNVPLDSLHKIDTEAFLSNEPIECIIPPDKKIFNKLKHPWNNFLQWGLGFKKKHLILEMIIDAIVNDYSSYVGVNFYKPKIAILSLTGTGQFTKIVREYIKVHGIDNLQQSGIYFEGKGIFSMKGSSVRHHLIKEYADIRNQSIL